MKDLYAILGLDSGASVQSIKIAYRQLARELHPDRMGDASPEEQAAASARMAEVNEAYAVLSRPEKRREYDLSVVATEAGEVVQAASPAPEAAPEPVEAQTAATRAARMRPEGQLGPEMVRQILNQIRTELTRKMPEMSWKATRLEGFDWGLESGFWPSKYVVAARGFALADLAALKKFVNYATVAVAQFRKPFRRNFFLLMVVFQRAADAEAISGLCSRFAEAVRSERAHPLMVLHDASTGQRLILGRRTTDVRFEKVMRALRLR